ELLAVAAVVQAGAAILAPVVPALGHVAVGAAAARARAAHPGEVYFIEGYEGPAAFVNGALALVLLICAALVAGGAYRSWAHGRAVGRWPVLGPWLIFGLVGCAAVTNPAAGVGIGGDPDGYLLVRAWFPAWYVPSLTRLWQLIGGLTVLNTAILGWWWLGRRRRPV
ncbi:MAG TPA: hypothetical protein VES42_10120, partial [Pilimelia sp.]|nr:hypothetical protein [Pilimelia sp.]